MISIQSISKQTLSVLIMAAVSIAAVTPTTGLAQQDEGLVLEEIIVTAQRREQALQQVPISVEVFSGSLVRQQGWRDLDDLANFSPTVLILPRVQDQDISIRGFGTTGNALTLDQAAPIFLDGIHFGRSSQAKLAFMDVESIEVLKGPQPVFFGQNATAGAFNIRSRRPTDTWQANVDLEVSENETIAFDGGIGGPLSETFAFRVAGKYDTSDGYLKDVVTGTLMGDYENVGGRLMLQWTPTDAFQATFKYESTSISKDSEITSLCRTAGPLIFGRGGPLDDPGIPPGDERSVWDDPPVGSGWSVDHVPIPTSCFDTEWGVSNGGPYLRPPDNIYEENSNRGSLDIREAAEAFTIGDRNKTTNGYEDIDSDNGYLELAYQFDNGISVEWLTGWSAYERDYGLDNSNTSFLMNYQGRGEDFDQTSSELRFTSGEGPIEWMAGVYWQETDLFAWSSSLRANVRRGQRYNVITEDVEFKAVFGTITFNFMDDRMSLDIGARYQDIDKFMTVEGYGATWVFNVEPVSAGVGGPPGCTEDDPVPCDYAAVDPNTARIFLPFDAAAGLWTINFRDTRNTPDEWFPSMAQPVGLTAPNFDADTLRLGGPWAENFSGSKTSPQLTWRYRLNDNTSFYARYAESFKIGGFDSGQTSIPSDIDELTFESEDAETYELGVKGTALRGRFSYDVALFELEFPNLQTTALSPDPEQTSASVNAGQRVRGLEFSTRWAATENLRFTFSGAFMDGEMTSFPGAGCTDAEISAALNDASAPCKIYDGDVLQVPPIDPLEAVDDFTALIDRSGSDAPRTPDWKFVLAADYSVPISSRFELFVNAKGYASDGYILDVESFSKIVKYNTHEDLNLMVGLGSLDGTWAVSVFGRNLLEARPSYNAEFDVFPDGLAATEGLGPGSFTTYGVKFTYRMQ